MYVILNKQINNDEKIHKRILKPPPTRQGKFSKHEELFKNPLDVLQN